MEYSPLWVKELAFTFTFIMNRLFAITVMTCRGTSFLRDSLPGKPLPENKKSG
jgi:hypothetical protein